MCDRKQGESSNWDNTFIDSNGDVYTRTGWSVYGGNEYTNSEGEKFHTSSSDLFNHSTEIEKNYP